MTPGLILDSSKNPIGNVSDCDARHDVRYRIRSRLTYAIILIALLLGER